MGEGGGASGNYIHTISMVVVVVVQGGGIGVTVLLTFGFLASQARLDIGRKGRGSHFRERL